MYITGNCLKFNVKIILIKTVSYTGDKRAFLIIWDDCATEGFTSVVFVDDVVIVDKCRGNVWETTVDVEIDPDVLLSVGVGVVETVITVVVVTVLVAVAVGTQELALAGLLIGAALITGKPKFSKDNLFKYTNAG